MVRIAAKKDLKMLKCIYTFLFTYKNVPLLYYGDEIGMKHNYKLNKDGGYVRTPMQWNNEKNRGFSNAKKLYLSISKNKNCCVFEQQKNPNSLYNFILNIIRIKKENDIFDFDSKIQILNKTYPLIYSREKNNKKVLVIINPTNKEVEINYCYKKVLFGKTEITDNKIKPLSSVVLSL